MEGTPGTSVDVELSKLGVIYTDLFAPVNNLNSKGVAVDGRQLAYIVRRFYNRYANPIQTPEDSTVRGLYIRRENEYLALVGIDFILDDNGAPTFTKFLGANGDQDVSLVNLSFVFKKLYAITESAGLYSSPNLATHTYHAKDENTLVSETTLKLVTNLNSGEVELIAHSGPIDDISSPNWTLLERLQLFNRKWLGKSVISVADPNGYIRINSKERGQTDLEKRLASTFDRNILSQGLEPTENGANITTSLLAIAGLGKFTDVVPLVRTNEDTTLPVFPKIVLDIALLRIPKLETVVFPENIDTNDAWNGLEEGLKKYLDGITADPNDELPTFYDKLGDKIEKPKADKRMVAKSGQEAPIRVFQYLIEMDKNDALLLDDAWKNKINAARDALSDDQKDLRFAAEEAEAAADKAAADKAAADKAAADKAAADKAAADKAAAAKKKAEEAAAAKKKAAEEAAAKKKAAEEAEAKRKAEEEAEARRKAEEEAEAKRKAEEEAEAKRKAEEEAEAKRKAEEEAEAKRNAEEEAEAKRKAEEEAEAKRKAEEEAEAKRKAEEEAEAKRKAEEEAEAKRKAEEEAEAKRKAEEEAEARRKAEEEAEARRKAEEEAEAKRKAEEEAEAKRKAEEEAAAKKKAEEEAQRLAAAAQTPVNAVGDGVSDAVSAPVIPTTIAAARVVVETNDPVEKPTLVPVGPAAQPVRRLRIDIDRDIIRPHISLYGKRATAETIFVEIIRASTRVTTGRLMANQVHARTMTFNPVDRGFSSVFSLWIHNGVLRGGSGPSSIIGKVRNRLYVRKRSVFRIGYKQTGRSRIETMELNVDIPRQRNPKETAQLIYKLSGGVFVGLGFDHTPMKDTFVFRYLFISNN
jgi:hypothetical protein